MQMINGAPIAANGRVAVKADLAAPKTFNSAFGYEANGALSVSTTGAAPQAWNAGFSFTVGRLRVIDALSILYPPTTYINGFPFDESGQLIVSSTLPINSFNNGWPMYVSANTLGEPSFSAPLNDLGGGVANLALDVGLGVATFTRASPAYTILANGKLKQVGANVPRAYYAAKAGVHPGQELVVNGNFAAGTTGWTGYPGATFNVVGGEAVCVSPNNSNVFITQPITLVKGRTYRSSIDFLALSNEGALRVNGVVISPGGYSNVLGTRQNVFTSQWNSATLEVVCGGASQSATFDNISVVELYPGHEYAGYLSEGAATNLVIQSADMTNAAWSVTEFTRVGSQPAPDNSLTATKLVESTAPSAYHYINGTNPTYEAGANYTRSVYAKAAGRNWLQIQVRTLDNAWHWAYFNILEGAVGTLSTVGDVAAIEALADGWFRCSLTYPSGTGSSLANDAYFSADNDLGSVYSGDGVSGIYLWGAQVEKYPFATSYIPTAGAAASRAHDALSYIGTDYAATAAGTAYAEVTFGHGIDGASPPRIVTFGDAAGAEVIPIYASASTTIGIFDGSTTATASGTVANDDVTRKYASTWGGTKKQISGDGKIGAEIAFDGVMDGANQQVNIGWLPKSLVYPANAGVKNVRLWKTQTPSIELQYMTGEGSPPIAAVCIASGAVPVNAFTNGFDTGYD